jgi:hypothetical protein
MRVAMNGLRTSISWRSEGQAMEVIEGNLK